LLSSVNPQFDDALSCQSINQLLEPKAASKIDIVLVEDMPYLGLTIVDTDKERHWGF